MSRSLTLMFALVQNTNRPPLPQGPVMEGPGWSVAIPAVLFIVSAAGTWALWRHFADQDDDQE